VIDVGNACDTYSTNGYYLRPDGSTCIVYGPDDMLESLTLTQVIRGCFHGVGATYRREVFDLVGGYRARVFGEDYDFWLRAMSMGARHCYLPAPLTMHRLSPAQKSSDAEAGLRSDIRILTDLENSGRLSRQERMAVHDSVCGRLALIAALDEAPLRRALRVTGTYLAHPASLVRAVGRRTRRMLRSASRADR
jgi:GT2 family glycosyltransferase